ncbi:MAG: hypothetical protein QOC99_2392 [Acidobacteriota bacterium]|jgi:hypothetical protein|nr:hypothetical protein [Acidobacteriota bacterium]
MNQCAPATSIQYAADRRRVQSPDSNIAGGGVDMSCAENAPPLIIFSDSPQSFHKSFMNSPANLDPLDEETTAAHDADGHTGPSGHPVRAAILISLVVFVVVAALVYGVFRFSIRPETETPSRTRMPSSR